MAAFFCAHAGCTQCDGGVMKIGDRVKHKSGDGPVMVIECFGVFEDDGEAMVTKDENGNEVPWFTCSWWNSTKGSFEYADFAMIALAPVDV